MNSDDVQARIYLQPLAPKSNTFFFEQSIILEILKGGKLHEYDGVVRASRSSEHKGSRGLRCPSSAMRSPAREMDGGSAPYVS